MCVSVTTHTSTFCSSNRRHSASTLCCCLPRPLTLMVAMQMSLLIGPLFFFFRGFLFWRFSSLVDVGGVCGFRAVAARGSAFPVCGSAFPALGALAIGLLRYHLLLGSAGGGLWRGLVSFCFTSEGVGNLAACCSQLGFISWDFDIVRDAVRSLGSLHIKHIGRGTLHDWLTALLFEFT